MNDCNDHRYIEQVEDVLACCSLVDSSFRVKLLKQQVRGMNFCDFLFAFVGATASCNQHCLRCSMGLGVSTAFCYAAESCSVWQWGS